MITISNIATANLIRFKAIMNSRIFASKLERLLNGKYPHISFKFFILRRKRCFHMGLEKALLSYPEHGEILNDIERFYNGNRNSDFELVNPPILVRTVTWKFDYILFRKSYRSIYTLLGASKTSTEGL